MPMSNKIVNFQKELAALARALAYAQLPSPKPYRLGFPTEGRAKHVKIRVQHARNLLRTQLSESAPIGTVVSTDYDNFAIINEGKILIIDGTINNDALGEELDPLTPEERAALNEGPAILRTGDAARDELLEDLVRNPIGASPLDE